MRPLLLRMGLALAAASQGHAAAAQDCRALQDRPFPGDGERVRLVRISGVPDTGLFAVFRARMAVNTDGAPTSYHPDDFLGRRVAINRIDNGIAIRRQDGARMTVAQKREVFDRWRAGNWAVPAGYAISWRNVIAAGPDGRPCIFRQGEFAGYFGSLTAERNGLSGAAAGECQAADQLDQRHIPAIVLRGGTASPLHGYGARKGDLVVALNPANGAVVPAIIGDTGDGGRIGKGSVALNMRLLGRDMPATYPQALGLDTGGQAMVVAVLPGSRDFRRERPYSAANIAERARRWAAENGYGTLEALAQAADACSRGL